MPLDEDNEHATYDPTRSAATSRPRPRPRSCSPRCARPTRPLDARQRMVGHVRPRGQPVLRRPAEPPSDDFIIRNAGTPSRSRSAGGPATRATRGRVLRLRSSGPDGFSEATLRPSQRAGIPTWASSSSTGTTSSPLPTRRRRARVRRPRRAMPARSASGTRRWPRASRARRPRSPDRPRGAARRLQEAPTRLPPLAALGQRWHARTNSARCPHDLPVARPRWRCPLPGI